MAIVSHTTRATPARMNVGRAARTIRSLTFSPESIEYPKSPCRTPFVAPLRNSGRKFGRPVGPTSAAGVGMEPRKVPFVSGLQKPIHRQYCTGIGWSSPQASLNLSRCSWVIRGLFANLAVGPPGAASRMPYTTTVIPNSTGIAWSTRRSTNFIIGGLPQPESGVVLLVPRRAAIGLRGRYTRGRVSRRAPETRRRASDGAPRGGAPHRARSGSVAGGLLLAVPVLGVPVRAGLRAVRKHVAKGRREQLDVLPVVQRDLEGLLDVDLLEVGHGVADLVEVHVVLDGIHGGVDVGVLDLRLVLPVGPELAAVVVEVVAERVDRRAVGMLSDVEVVVRQDAWRLAVGLGEVGEDVVRRYRVDDAVDPHGLEPRTDQRERVLPNLASRRAELDLRGQAVLLDDAVAIAVGPAAVGQDLLGLLGVERRRRLVRVEPRRRADVRVGNDRVATEETGVDLVLVDRVGDGLADRRILGRAPFTAVLDGGVA